MQYTITIGSATLNVRAETWDHEPERAGAMVATLGPGAFEALEGWALIQETTRGGRP